MEEKVIFFQLTHKFVNNDDAMPEGPRQVIYYSLAIGHHVGVMDCFQPLFELPLEEFRGWLEGLPEGAARQKLGGLLRWGEIEINHSHAADLLNLLLPASLAGEGEKQAWQRTLLGSLQAMLHEPALYMMVRKVP